MSTKIGYGLVRDKDGKPKIDDPSSVHPAVIALLTEQEKQELGIWTGPHARDAQGTKRLEKTADGYRAVDNLVAVTEIYDGELYVKLAVRSDVLAGTEIKLEI